jgi:hypothetical protein
MEKNPSRIEINCQVEEEELIFCKTLVVRMEG